VDPAAWKDLPSLQRAAVEQILQREHAFGAATDQRVVAAAFLAVIERLSGDGPVLVAIDDLQWLDPSTAHVVAYTARRLSGPVGFSARCALCLRTATRCHGCNSPGPMP